KLAPWERADFPSLDAQPPALQSTLVNRQFTGGPRYFFSSSSSGGGGCSSALAFSAAFCLASALFARFSANFWRTSEPTNSSTAKSAPSPFRQPVRTIRV